MQMTVRTFSKNGSLSLPAPYLAPFTILFDLISKYGSHHHISRWNFLTENQKKDQPAKKKQRMNFNFCFHFLFLIIDHQA